MTNKQKIIYLVNELKPLLELEHWKIEVRESEGKESSIYGDVTAEIDPIPHYQEAVLTFYPELMKNDADTIKKIVLHELSHCLTKEVSNIVNRMFRDKFVTMEEEHIANERLTSWIARIVEPRLK